MKVRDMILKLKEADEKVNTKKVDEDGEQGTVNPDGTGIPPQDVDPNGDDPSTADAAAKEAGIDDNGTIVNTFTPQEKETLLKQIKHGEYSPLEAAVLRILMGEACTLDELGVMLGATSKKTKGAPMSKVAALKELNRILAIVAKRSKLKLGKAVDLTQISKVKREIRQQNAEKRRQAKEKEKYRREMQKQFWQELKELNKVQRQHGLKPSRYDKMYTTQGEFNKYS